MTIICRHSVLNRECDDAARLTNELADVRAERDGLKAIIGCCSESLGEPIPAYLPDAIKDLQSALEAARKDGDQLRHFINNNMTFYDTNESHVPVLASVSKRIWYHATDDVTSYPFDAVIHAAIDSARGAP